ncbi:MAG: hypothetical protein ACXWCK_33575, partial [Burkholderiales bacterium]
MSKLKLGSLWVVSIALTVYVMIIINGRMLHEQKREACLNDMYWAFGTAMLSGKSKEELKDEAYRLIRDRPYSKECAVFGRENLAP